MPATEVTCPSDNDLLAFARGQLAADQWDVVESHVSECDVCVRRLDGLQLNDDHFMAELRGVQRR